MQCSTVSCLKSCTDRVHAYIACSIDVYCGALFLELFYVGGNMYTKDSTLYFMHEYTITVVGAFDFRYAIFPLLVLKM